MLPMSFQRAGARVLSILAGVCLAIAVGCTEHTVGSQACAQLCPNTNVIVKDTSFELQVTDTTLLGFPTFGLEQAIMLASVANTLDTRGVIRFDSLQTAYLPPGFTVDSAPVAITHPDSVRLRLHADTLHSHVPSSFTINVYDVDTTSTDSLTQLLVPLMRPSRLIGSRTFTSADWLDTVSIPIDSAKFRAILLGTGRMRVGLRVVAGGSPVLVRFRTSETQFPAEFRYKAAPDSGAATITLLPRSNTPQLFATAQSAFADFMVVVLGTPVQAANTMSVGGIPGHRPVLSFAIPSAIVDSTEIVRATLTMTQLPRRTYRDADTTAIYPLVFSSTTNVTDAIRAASFAQPLFGASRQRYSSGAWSDSLRLVPKDSGTRQVELTAIFREWRINGTFLQRVLALRVADEGFSPAELRFFNARAPSGLRPRLRILYVPHPAAVTP